MKLDLVCEGAEESFLGQLDQLVGTGTFGWLKFTRGGRMGGKQ